MPTKKGYLVPIIIQLLNGEQTSLNDLLGKEDDIELQQVPLRFVSIDCFWIDPEENDDTKTKDIIFYINGASFRTPYNPEREKLLMDAMGNNATIVEEQAPENLN